MQTDIKIITKVSKNHKNNSGIDHESDEIQKRIKVLEQKLKDSEGPNDTAKLQAELNSIIDKIDQKLDKEENEVTALLEKTQADYSSWNKKTMEFESVNKSV